MPALVLLLQLQCCLNYLRGSRSPLLVAPYLNVVGINCIILAASLVQMEKLRASIVRSVFTVLANVMCPMSNISLQLTNS